MLIRLLMIIHLKHPKRDLTRLLKILITIKHFQNITQNNNMNLIRRIESLILIYTMRIKKNFIKHLNQLTIKTNINDSLPYLYSNKIKHILINTKGKCDMKLKKKLKENVEHFNEFNINESKRIYLLKVYSNISNSFIGYIFFESNKSTFLLFININTIKEYSYQLVIIEINDEIDLVNGTETFIFKYLIGGKKTFNELMKVFDKYLNVSLINLLKFNGESVINLPDFQRVFNII